jgi:hypothetical protein
MFCPKNISFECSEKNEKKPAESQAHMHVAQTEISFKDFSVYQAFHEDLLDAQGKWQTEETSLKTKLVGCGKITEPDYTPCYNIQKNEV